MKRDNPVTVYVADELLDRFDDTINFRTSNRSEAVRNAMWLWVLIENPEDTLQSMKDSEAEPSEAAADA
jgi:metal-responsive CopG/Arc/MetJ family transcriptional regulator